MKYTRGEIVELRVEKLVYPNMGQGLLDGEIVQFKGGLPGQKVRVKLKKKKNKKISGEILEVLEASPLEKNAPCPMFEFCGGCDFQTISYESELMIKHQEMRDLFNANNLDGSLMKINRNPRIKGYRNKMEYSFGDEVKDGKLVLGLHKRKMFYSIVDTLGCNIVDEDFNIIREYSQNFFASKEVTYYHKKTLKGYLRHLILRKSFNVADGEIMVNLVTTSQDIWAEEKEDQEIKSKREKVLLDQYLEGLLKLKTNGKIESVVKTTNNSLADAVIPEKVDLLWGRPYISEEILDLRFNISPFSFFQPNVFTAKELYTRVRDFAGGLSGKLVYDLYSGTGTISQVMAKTARKVIGVEIVEEAVRKAYENANINGLYNIEFRANDVLKEIESLKEDVDLVVLDPPREGIHPKALEAIRDMGAEKIIYISCNPKSFVRDMETLGKVYKLEKAEAFDQFSRTKHVETIALIQKM